MLKTYLLVFTVLYILHTLPTFVDGSRSKNAEYTTAPTTTEYVYEEYTIAPREIALWIKHMNHRSKHATKTLIRDAVYTKKHIASYLKKLNKKLHLGGVHFYQKEFDYCDLDKNQRLSQKEVSYCAEKANDMMMNHMKYTVKMGKYLPKNGYVFSLNMTRLQVRTQKTTGLTFNQFYKLKVFIAMSFGRALYFEHDNIYGQRSKYICSSEWYEVSASMRGIFSGYSEYDSWDHFDEFDLNTSYALEEEELYLYFDNVWKRWFLTEGKNTRDPI